MMAKANKVHFTVIFVLMSFAFSEGSFITYNTQEGCNATLVCNQPGNVTWVYTATSQKIEGPRFQTLTHAFFSTLSIVDVSRSDSGNITCMAEGHNLTTDVKVCHNDLPLQQCLTTINAAGNCTTQYIRAKCKQSCKLCPEPDCPEAVLPTMPPTTANPQTTNDSHQPTTESDSTVSSSTRNVENGEYDGNSGVSLAAGFHIVFVLASSVYPVIISVFPNV